MSGRYFITGDKHGDFSCFSDFCKIFKTTKDDTIILLGDAGINYHVSANPEYIDNGCIYKNSKKMIKLKSFLESLPITFFCIHGNHEARPESIASYKIKKWNQGNVFYEEEYPSLNFSKDGEIYNIDNNKVLVIGGAYSIDKEYRLIRYAQGFKDYKWFSDEQPSQEVMEAILEKINKVKKVDIVLSHTCPLKYEPTEVFLKGIQQNEVDKTTEKFLDTVEEKIQYDKWYCGHYHTDKTIDNIIFMFHTMQFLQLNDKG